MGLGSSFHIKARYTEHTENFQLLQEEWAIGVELNLTGDWIHLNAIRDPELLVWYMDYL